MRFAAIDALVPIFTPSKATTRRPIPNSAHKTRTCANTDSMAAVLAVRNREIVT